MNKDSDHFSFFLIIIIFLTKKMRATVRNFLGGIKLLVILLSAFITLFEHPQHYGYLNVSIVTHYKSRLSNRDSLHKDLRYTHHNKYTPFKIDKLPSSDSFTVKNYTYHWLYFIHFQFKLYMYYFSQDTQKKSVSILPKRNLQNYL